MTLLNKIAEFRRDQQMRNAATVTYRVADSDLVELAKFAEKYKTDSGSADFTLSGAIEFYERENDLFMIKQWLADNPLRIFGYNIVLDKPYYNKTFNY